MVRAVGAETRTACPYCGVGCGVLAARKDDGSVEIRGDPDHPANFGRLCSKGSALGETVDLEGRLLYPEIGGVRTHWDEALTLVASRFAETIAERGPDSVAFYVSGQLLTEDYYAANKLMKGYIGTANIDTNSRLCMASSVAGHRRAFGADTVPGCYEDLELADLIVLAGSNLAWCHPVLYQRIAAAKQARPDMKIVLIDPRRTMSADIADMHLAIRPDGDTPLFLGLLAFLEKAGKLDHAYLDAFVTGSGTALEIARSLAMSDIAAATGLSQHEIGAFYALSAGIEKTVTIYSQGINQSATGTDKVNAIVNCHLATGRIGRPGMGPFSVTGQPNAMGGREVGGLANMLAAHMDLENSMHRELVQGFWSSPTIACRPGLKAVEMFRAVGDGRIKALWIMATNPVVSMPDAGAVEEAIRNCPFVVVSDVMAQTDTSRHAHVKLPATAWGEKDGTVTNSERRITRQRRFMPMPGSARPDWWIVAEVARRMGFGEAFAWSSPAEIFAEHAALSGFANSGTRDFDISAHSRIDAARYDALAPFQWPAASGARPNEITRFFARGGFYTPDRKARMVPVRPPERRAVDPEFPLTLNTGRVRDHWHTMTRTGKSPRLSGHIAEPFCEIHPADAEGLGIADASLVRLRSASGEIVVRALITRRQQPGSLFVPMHWNDQFASSARVDRLVAPVTDPFSGQPASKTAAVSAEPFVAVAYGFAISAEMPQTKEAGYWATARARGGWRTELAFANAPDDAVSLARTLFSAPSDSDFLAYSDAPRARRRIAAFAGDKLLGALFLSDEPVEVARSSVVGLLAQDFTEQGDRLRVLAGRAGAYRPDPGPLVCSCFGIGANEIAACIRAGASSVQDIGERTSAGTNCGSCRSEIGGILDAHRVVAAE